MGDRLIPADRVGHRDVSSHRARARLADLRLLVNRHRWLVVVTVLGLVLRVAAWVAEYPALLLFGDSYEYWNGAATWRTSIFHPFGYPLFLALLRWTGSPAVITAVQHLLGLALGVGVYALLVRFGVRRWLAAVAAATELLDAYQVILEQYLLAETVFEVVLLAATATLLIRRSVPAGLLAGGLFALAILVRPTALPLPLVAAGVVLLRRDGWRRFGSILVGSALLLAPYAAWYHAQHGQYALTGFGGRWLYGRVAAVTDCSRVALPRPEGQLCGPPAPFPVPDARNEYTWGRSSPLGRLRVPPGRSADDIAGSFARRMILAEPWAYLRSVGGDVADYLGPTRTTDAEQWPVSDWQFRSQIDPAASHTLLARDGTLSTHAELSDIVVNPVQRPAVPIGLLQRYQRYGYTPGWALALGGLLSLLVAGLGRPCRERRAIGLMLTFTGLVLVGMPAATSVFDYRYLIPANIPLVAAGVLAADTLLRHFSQRNHRRQIEGRTSPSLPAVEGRKRARDRADDEQAADQL